MNKIRRRPINRADIANYVSSMPSVIEHNTAYDQLVQEELNKLEGLNAEYEERQKNMRKSAQLRAEELSAVEQSDFVDTYLMKPVVDRLSSVDEDTGEIWGWNKDNWQDRTKQNGHGIRFYDDKTKKEHSYLAKLIDASLNLYSKTPVNSIDNGAIIGKTLLALAYDKTKMSDWVENVVDYFNILKNESEIKDAEGNVVRAREKQQMLNIVEQFLNNNLELLSLQNLLTSKYTSNSSQDIHARWEILQDMQNLINANTWLLPQVKAAATYEYNDVTARFSPMPEYMPHERRNTGITAVHIKNAIDLFNSTDWGNMLAVVDQNKFQRNFDRFAEQKFKYDKYVEDNVIPEAAESIRNDQEDLKRYYVDPKFKTRAEYAQRSMKFNDLDTYLYGLPGVLGSSASNNGILLTSLAIKLLGTGLTASGAGAEFGIPLTFVGAALGVASGEHENNAEVASNYTEILLKKLERTDNVEKFLEQTSKHAGQKLNIELAIRHFLFNPESIKDEEIKSIAAQTLLGANNLFTNDMMAVTGSELLEASIGMFVPLGGRASQAILGKGWKAAAAETLTKFAERHPKAGALAKLAAKTASEVSPGTPMTMGTELVWGASKQALKRPYNWLSRELSNRILFLSKELLENPGQVMATKSLIKGSAKLIGAELGMGLSESIEEGKQHIHGEAFKKGEFAGDKHDLFDIVMNDISAEARAGYAFITNTLFGIKSDPELLAEMRGGFLAPFGNITAIRIPIGYTSNIYHEMKADHLVGNNVMAMKLQDQLDIQNGILYAKASFDPTTYSFALNSFNKLKNEVTQEQERVEANGEEYQGFTLEEIEAQEKEFKKIASLASDKSVQLSAIDRGIKPGTEDYATLIGLYNYGLNRLEESNARIIDNEEVINKLINNLIVSEEELQQILIATMGAVRDLLFSRNKESEEVTSPQRKTTETDEEWYNRANTEYRLNALEYINRRRNYMSLIANIDAIMRRIELLEAIQNRTKAQDDQLAFFKNKLTETKHKISKEDADRIGINIRNTSEEIQLLANPTYREDHESLVEAYDRLLLEEIAFDDASTFVTELIGTSILGTSILDDSQAISIIQRIGRESNKANEGIKKSIKSKTKRILDEYKDVVKQDKQFVQYLHDAFYEQKDALDKLWQEYEKEEGVEEKPFDLTEEEADEAVALITAEYEMPEVGKSTDYTGIEDEDLYPSVNQDEKLDLLEEYAAEGKRGRKQVNAAKNDLNNATSDLDQINAVNRFELNVSRGAYATGKEKKTFADLRAKFESEGYETPLKVGLKYDEGQKVEAEFRNDDTLAPGELKIVGILRPLINKDGKMILSGKIVVAQSIIDKQLPIVPTTPSANLNPNDPQLNTLQLLRQTVSSLSGNVTKTGEDYFIKVGNRVVRYPRVHSVKEPLYNKPKTVYTAIEENYAKLANLYDTDIEAFKAEARRLAEQYNKELAERFGEDSVIYRDQKASIEQYLEDDVVSDRAIIQSVANIVSFGLYKDKPIFNVPSRSVTGGNILDSIQRAIFCGKELQYSTSFGMPKEIFDKYVADIKHQKEAYERDGYIIFTDEITLFGIISYRGYTVTVAGQPDMLLIDKDGNIKIVDFKSSKYSYLPVYRYTKNVPGFGLMSYTTSDKSNVPSDAVSVVIEYPALDTVNIGANMTTRQSYEEQLVMYSDLIQDMFSQNGVKVTGFEILPTNVRIRAGKNNEGFIDSKVFDRFASEQESVLIDNDEALRSANYVELRTPIQLEVTSKKEELSASITEQPTVDLTTLMNLVSNLMNARVELENAYKSTSQTLSQDLLAKMRMSKQIYDELLNRYSLLLEDADQQANLDTVKQLESDVQSYINTIESFIEELNSLPKEEIHQDPIIPQNTFKPQQVEFTDGIYLYVHIEQNLLDRLPYAAELRRVMALPDFLEKATFELDVDGWKRPRRNPKAYGVDYIKSIKYTEIKPDGTKVLHEFGKEGGYVPILLHLKNKDGQTITRNDVSLVRIINGLLNDPANKGKRIFLKPGGRTNGRAIYGEKEQSLSQAIGLSDEQLALLLDGSEYGQLGSVSNGNIRAILHNSNESEKILHPFKPGEGLSDGMIVVELNMRYTEDGNEPWKHSLPVMLSPRKLQDTDINLIIDCLLNWHKSRNINIGGKVIKSPLTNRQLLTLLIRFGNQSTITKSNFVFDFQTDGLGAPNYRIVRFGGLRIGDNLYSEILQYNLDIPSSVEALKQELAKVSVYYNSEYVLRQSTSETDDTKKLAGLKKFFQEHPEIDTLPFSDSVVFDRKDVDPDGDNSYKGISIAHWMMRHNWMTTRFTGVSDPLLAFNGAYVEDQNIIQQEVELTEQPEDEAPISGLSIIYDPNAEQEAEDDDQWNPNAWLNKKQKGVAKKPLDPEKAKKRIRRILGKDFDVSIIPDLIDQDDRVVGRMRIASITLSTLAESGTEFHEAFHDVLEFKVGEKRRQRIYDHYRNRYGNGKKLSDTQVTEALADRYMDFRNGTEVDTGHVLTDFFKSIAKWVKSLYKLHDAKLARLFIETSMGLYSPDSFISLSKKNPYTAESIQNFLNRFNRKYLDYSVLAHNGEHIKLLNFSNDKLFSDALEGLLYMLIRGAKIDNLGTNLDKLDTSLEGVRLTLGEKTYSSLIGFGISDEELDKLPLNQRRNIRMMRELIEKWNILTRRKLIEKFEAIGVNSKLKRDNQRKEELEGDNTSAVHEDIEGHDDEFWSHSRGDDISSAVRFFLSTIPALRYATEEDIKSGLVGSDGKVITSLVTTNKKGQQVRTKVVTRRNSLGYTSFLPFNYVYQTLLKHLYNVKNAEELDIRLTQAAQNDLMFEHIARAFHNFRFKSYVRYSDDVYKRIPKVVVNGVLLDPSVYVKDLNNLSLSDLYPTFVTAVKEFTLGDKLIQPGERIPGAIIVTNPDYESITTLIFLAIKSQRLDFTFCFQNSYKNEQGVDQKGRYTYNTSSTNSELAQRNYPHSWFNNVRSLYGAVLNKLDKSKPTVFKLVAELLRQMRTEFATVASGRSQTVLGLNPNSLVGFDSLVSVLITNLNKIGITIDKQMFNYMLILRYPEASNIQNAFMELMTSRGIGSINTLIDENGVLDLLLKAIDTENFETFTIDKPEDAKRNQEVSGSYLYAGNTFIKTLSLWYGRYKAASQEMHVLGPNNTDMYLFAENHSASDIVDDLKRAVVDVNGRVSGSEILQELVYQQKGSTEPVYYNSFIDRTGTRIGGIIIKTLMNPEFNKHLQIVLHTYSGMKSDLRRDGGRKYTEITRREDWISKADMLSNGYIIFPTLSDKSTWFYLSGFVLPGLLWRNGRLATHDLNLLLGVDSKDNIHIYDYSQIDQLIEYVKCDLANALFVQEQLRTGAIPESKMVKNFHTGDQHGARLAFMIGMYDEDGNYISFNNNKRTPEQDIHEAYAHFFNQPLDVQRQIMVRSVQKRLEVELLDLVERGIITYNEGQTNGRSKLFGYSNKYLDASKIDQLKNLYKSKINLAGKRFDQILTDALLESLAILTYVNDVNVRSNISLQETLRMFTGMPHFFKWKYDKNSGELLDMREDESKRYGGTGSTGTNNRQDLPNIETEYTCAEIEDWEVGSPIHGELRRAFLDNRLRQAVVDSRIQSLYKENPLTTIKDERKVYREVYNKEVTVELLQQELGKLASVFVKLAEKEADAYAKEINVADGTAFITDKMAENLLRQRGVYTKQVAKAFAILRREHSMTDDYLSDSQAYRIVFDALISTLKYSAFGYRKEYGIPVHFYNKFALFPIFESISYGFTHELYQKMNGIDGVDMVMFTSAVKAGSESAQRFNPEMSQEEIEAFTFKGHTYKQKYSFIRRQLNTDPRTDEVMSMGTQAAKVALSVLRDAQEYLMDDGTTMSGEALKTQIMDDINDLAKCGYNAVRKEFFNEDGRLSIEKLSAFIKHELASRNADKNILDAVEVVYDKDSGGNIIPSTARFKADLNAVSNMNWIESIIVSHINSLVIDINLPGNAYYQRSVFGMEGAPYHTMNAEDFTDYQINDGKDLQMINEDGSMDAVISIDYFMHLIPEEIRYNFEAARQWLIDSGIIRGKANIMAYRIPTQAPSSIHALRIVDVVPTLRDTIILPKEFTKITGSDFD